jgi:HTH DNA binding domain
LRLLDLLYKRPLADVKLVKNELGVSFGTANKLVENLQGLGLLSEVSGRKRDRVFRFDPYLRLFEEEEERPSADEVDFQVTEPVSN